MMRRTAACAGLALAIYLSAWIPLNSKPAEMTQALSLQGIDTVVLQGNPESVTFSTQAPGASYNPSELPQLLERRKGRVLVVYPQYGALGRYSIVLPRTIRRLDVEGTHIVVESDVAMTQLEVRASDNLYWTGNIPRLDLVNDSSRTPVEDCDYCGPSIMIYSGKISDLRVTTQRGDVTLQEPDDVAHTTLALGPDARYSLGMGRKQAKLRLLTWQPGTIDALPTEPTSP